MPRSLRSLLVLLLGFALGAVATRVYDARREERQARAANAAAPNAPIRRPVNVDFTREPLWAYGFTSPAKPGDSAPPQAAPTRKPRPTEDAQEQLRPRRVDGSAASYSLVQVRNLHDVIDWFPGDHPRMPDIIEHGPHAMGDQSRGCGSCHLPNGRGRPENAPVGGLPIPYFLRQIDDFRRGARSSADPRKANTPTMIALARAMSDAEVRQAAEYFASIPPPRVPWIRVVESAMVPRTRIAANLFLPAKQPGSEPIDGRIIEMPEDEEQAETLRNPRSGFVAYVPPGSIAKGEDLVVSGGMKVVDGKIVQGRTTACATCHGPALSGVADVPPIAGRSPSYLARQLWDIQQGTRSGTQVQLMKLVVASLTPEDLVAIAAYVASRPG